MLDINAVTPRHRKVLLVHQDDWGISVGLDHVQSSGLCPRWAAGDLTCRNRPCQSEVDEVRMHERIIEWSSQGNGMGQEGQGKIPDNWSFHGTVMQCNVRHATHAPHARV